MKEEFEEPDYRKKFFSDEKDYKTFSKIFNIHSINVIHSLASKGFINQIEFVISTGKEAHVFRASDGSGNFLAAKIYKIETSEFNKMNQYVQGDYRFKKVKKDKKELVFAWTRKEFKNLEKANNAGVRVPLPIVFKENILIMEFIGENGIASPKLKDTVCDYKYVYEKIIESIARMLYLEELVHADLSEYNILMQKGEPVIIDIGQGVLTTHPKAKEFFERDAQNIANFFSKKGVNTDYEKVIEDIKKWKKKLLEKD
ncbi:MAG: serine protein kinase RIO [Candidatus Diapherotrites archaeon]|nr:serine protein kinase RIO [Candidatus Diapherotrites archaeon]